MGGGSVDRLRRPVPSFPKNRPLRPIGLHGWENFRACFHPCNPRHPRFSVGLLTADFADERGYYNIERRPSKDRDRGFAIFDCHWAVGDLLFEGLKRSGAS